MKNFKELIVWQRSFELSLLVYEVTKQFPQEERYGLMSQIRRSAISIPSNIAEGHMRTTNKDFKQFIAIARGSCAELETQLSISQALGYISDGLYQPIEYKLSEVSRMLGSLYSKI